MSLPPAIFRFGARSYEWMTAHEHWHRHAAQLASFAPGAPGGRRIVDLGCGPGNSTLAIAAACADDVVIGLDLVEPMLRRAQRADRARRCIWLRGDAHRLPLRDASADAITGHSFLYLLPDRHAALAEMRRVLRPGGALALLEPAAPGLAGEVRGVAATLRTSGPRLAFTMAMWRAFARASGPFGAGELARTLEAAGFSSVQQRPTLHGLAWIGVGHR